jgi:putative transcriptional regulator
MSAIVPGSLLIAGPFLKDPNFQRSVVLLCEHQEQGSMGFILNKTVTQTLDELLPEISTVQMQVSFGGPLQLDTMQFIHQAPHLIQGGLEIANGIFWGGDFEKASYLVNAGKLSRTSIRFFAGYSGWSSGQLEGELKEKSWILSPASPGIIFNIEDQHIWKESLQKLGDDFALMANFPIDPSLN